MNNAQIWKNVYMYEIKHILVLYLAGKLSGFLLILNQEYCNTVLQTARYKLFTGSSNYCDAKHVHCMVISKTKTK